MDDISKDIRKILPDLSREQAQDVAKYLVENKFATLNDLADVEFEDLMAIESLGRGECRKLIRVWKQRPAGTCKPSLSFYTKTRRGSRRALREGRRNKSCLLTGGKRPYCLHSRATHPSPPPPRGSAPDRYKERLCMTYAENPT